MQIAAGRFKATCLRLMDEVNQSHESVIITKRGKPSAKLVAVEEKITNPLFGFLKNSVVSQKNIIDPIGENWDANE